jgi:hypothetical protein
MWNFYLFLFGFFLVSWFQYSLLEYCLITIRISYVDCSLNLPFVILSVICRLHNFWPPFKVLFYLVLPIVFSFRAHTFFNLGTKRRFSWKGTNMSNWKFNNNCINKFAGVSKIVFDTFMLNVESCCSRCKWV